MLLHSIAKSAVNPIFSPLPHPTFFVPKSPFFLLFSIQNSISGDFSRDRARFLPSVVHSFSCFPRFKSDFGRFFRGLAPPFSFALLFSQNKTLFPIRAFLFTHPLLHLPLRIYSPSVPHSSLTFTPPHFLLHSSPLFHLSPQLTHKRAHSRALRAYTYERTHPHFRRFSFIAFTPSPTSCNPLYINALGVKKNEKRPSQNTQPPLYQQIKNKIPISSAVNPTCSRGEPKKTKAFTPYALCHNHLRHTGEGVKAKNENRLTRARTREGKREGKKDGGMQMESRPCPDTADQGSS